MSSRTVASTLAGCRRLGAWLLVAVWMVLIFAGSTDLLSERRTSRYIGPILRWFKPDLSDRAIRNVQIAIRKTGHLTEFAVLCLLVQHALARPGDGGAGAPVGSQGAGARLPAARGGWDRRRAVLALLVCVLYAASDEAHQTLVASRDGTVRDVLIDAAGAAFGLAIARYWGRRSLAPAPQGAVPTRGSISAGTSD
jgi:uncharacterized protein YfiM (DUF2279 family)